MSNLGTATLRIVATTSQAVASIRQLTQQAVTATGLVGKASMTTVGMVASAASAAQKSVRRLGNDLNQVGRNFRTTGLNATIAGAAMTKTFTNAMNVGAEFERSMDMVAAKGQISELSKEFKELEQRAIGMAERTRFTAVDAANTIQSLTVRGVAELGMDPKTGESLGKDFERVAQAADVSLDLASIGDIDPTEAAGFIGQMVKAFDIPAEKIGEIRDGIAAVSQEASTTVPEMGTAMSFVAGQASLLDQQRSEIYSALGVMSDLSIRGSRAGTGLARIFTRLSNTENTAVKKALGNLGLSFKDVAASEDQGIIEIMDKIKAKGFGAVKAMSELAELGVDVEAISAEIDKMGDISPAESVDMFRSLAQQSGVPLAAMEENLTNVASMYQLFGQRGGPAALALLKSLPKWKKLKRSVEEASKKDESGLTLGERMARDVESNVIGGLLRMRSKVASVSIALFESIKKPLTELIEYGNRKLSIFIGFLKKNNKVTELATLLFGGLSVGLLAFGLTILALSGPLLLLGGIIESLILLVTPLSAALAALGVGAMVALTAFLFKLITRFDEFKAKLEEFDIPQQIVKSFHRFIALLAAFGKFANTAFDKVVDSFFSLMGKIRPGAFSPITSALTHLSDLFLMWAEAVKVATANIGSVLAPFSANFAKMFSRLFTVLKVELKAVSNLAKQALEPLLGKPDFNVLDTFTEGVRVALKWMSSFLVIGLKLLIMFKLWAASALSGLWIGFANEIGELRYAFLDLGKAFSKVMVALDKAYGKFWKKFGSGGMEATSSVERWAFIFSLLGNLAAKILAGLAMALAKGLDLADRYFDKMLNLAEYLRNRVPNVLANLDNFLETGTLGSFLDEIEAMIVSFMNWVGDFVLTAIDPILSKLENRLLAGLYRLSNKLRGEMPDWFVGLIWGDPAAAPATAPPIPAPPEEPTPPYAHWPDFDDSPLGVPDELSRDIEYTPKNESGQIPPPDAPAESKIPDAKRVPLDTLQTVADHLGVSLAEASSRIDKIARSFAVPKDANTQESAIGLLLARSTVGSDYSEEKTARAVDLVLLGSTMKEALEKVKLEWNEVPNGHGRASGPPPAPPLLPKVPEILKEASAKIDGLKDRITEGIKKITSTFTDTSEQVQKGNDRATTAIVKAVSEKDKKPIVGVFGKKKKSEGDAAPKGRIAHGVAVMEAAIAKMRGTAKPVDHRAETLARLRKEAKDAKQADRDAGIDRIDMFSPSGLDTDFGNIKASMQSFAKEPTTPYFFGVIPDILQDMKDMSDQAKMFLLQSGIVHDSLIPDWSGGDLSSGLLANMTDTLPIPPSLALHSQPDPTSPPAVTELNDNRTLEVTVNNNIDGEELTRKLENMFFNPLGGLA